MSELTNESSTRLTNMKFAAGKLIGIALWWRACSEQADFEERARELKGGRGGGKGKMNALIVVMNSWPLHSLNTSFAPD